MHKMNKGLGKGKRVNITREKRNQMTLERVENKQEIYCRNTPFQ